jgi:hypothetical protein
MLYANYAGVHATSLPYAHSINMTAQMRRRQYWDCRLLVIPQPIEGCCKYPPHGLRHATTMARTKTNNVTVTATIVVLLLESLSTSVAKTSSSVDTLEPFLAVVAAAELIQ